MTNSEPNGAQPPWRLGIVGCGKVVERFHLPALKHSPVWRLVAASDPLEARRAWMRQSWPGLTVYMSAEELFKEAALDACLIATPPATHYAAALQALEAGLHVLIEKPMTLRIDEARRLRDLARQRNLQVWVGFNRRFARPYTRLRQALQTIPRGSLHAMTFALIFDVTGWNPVTAHLGDDAQGSGVLDDVVSHQADLLAWLLDQPVYEVRSAVLDTSAPGAIRIRYTLGFADNTTVACVAGHGGGYVEQLRVQLADRQLVMYPSGVVSIVCIPTRLITPISDWLFRLNLLFHKLTRTPTVAAHSFERQWSAFAQALHAPHAPATGADAPAGVRAVEVVQACREALGSGGSYQIQGADT